MGIATRDVDDEHRDPTDEPPAIAVIAEEHEPGPHKGVGDTPEIPVLASAATLRGILPGGLQRRAHDGDAAAGAVAAAPSELTATVWSRILQLLR